MKIGDSEPVLLPLLPAIALVLRLAGYARAWLPSPGILVLLVLLAHALAFSSKARRARARTFFRRHAFAFALGGVIALVFLACLPGLAADVGHAPLDIDENRLAASVKHFFDTGSIDHVTVEHYPGVVFWIFAAASFLRYVRGLTSGVELPPDQIAVASYVVAARLANVCIAAGIVWLTGLIGRRVSGAGAALLAAVVVAIVPLSVETVTVVRNDPGMVLTVLGAVYAALMAHDTGRRGWLLTAAVLAGLATGIKYSSLFAIVPVLVAGALTGTARERFERLAIATLAFAAAVAVSNHFIWWDFPNFLRQLTAQVALTASGHWAATENPSGFYMMVLSRFGPGVVLLVLAGAFTVYALCTRHARLWIVLSFPLLYLSFMTQRPAQFPRWVFPLVPFVAVAGAAALTAVLRTMVAALPTGQAHTPSIAARAAMAVVLIAAAAQPAWNGIVSFSRRVTPATHTLAEQWLASHAAPGSVVASDLHFLDFTQSQLKVRRLDLDAVMRAEAIEQFAGADWLVVPEPYFGNPMLRRLGFVQRFHADRTFGGHMGYDYEIYAVPKMPEHAQ